MIRGLSSGEHGADTSFDPEYKRDLLTEFYGKLFDATDSQGTMPTWARLGDKFEKKDLRGMPRIDGALLRKAIHLFKNNKSCAEDNVVSEMLRVLDEDVLDLLADAIQAGV